MPVQIPERKTPSLSPSAGEQGGKKELESILTPSLEAVEAGAKQLENEGRKIILESDLGKTPPASDNADLSEESKIRDITPEQRRERMNSWTLEESDLWALLLCWLPEGELSMQTELGDLLKLYQSLLEAVLKNSQGQAQQHQQGRLENALSVALNHLFKEDMAGLKEFFEAYGTKSQVNFLKANLYRMAAGKVLPERELDRFWQMGSDDRGMQKAEGTIKNGTAHTKIVNTKTINTKIVNTKASEAGMAEGDKGSGRTKYHSLSQEGIIYGPKGNETIERRFYLSGQQVVRQGGAQFEASASALTGSTCSAKDLRLSEQFIRYFTGGGNLLNHEYFTGRSEEMLGILLSLTSAKCQEFCTASGISAPMRIQLQAVTDQMIDSFLQQAERDISKEQTRTGKQLVPLNHKEVFKIYYEVMELYRRYGKPEKAILEGLRAAVWQFREKKTHAAFKDTGRYSENAVFFHDLERGPEIKRHTLFEDLKEGKKYLERDWREFMKYIGKSGKKSVSLVPEEQSFWGSIAEPEYPPVLMPRRHYLGIILTGLFAAVFLFVFFRII